MRDGIKVLYVRTLPLSLAINEFRIIFWKFYRSFKQPTFEHDTVG
jgi:hypothetical protein